MNKELDKLICDIDSKISVFRLNNEIKKKTLDTNDTRYKDLVKIQKLIHDLYFKNIDNKGIVKGVD
jgi:hypothetical protein